MASMILCPARTLARTALVIVFCFAVPVAAQTHDSPTLRLSLDAVERRLVEVSPDVALARAGIAGAEADLESARARPNPTLSISTAGADPHAGVGNGPIGDKRLDSILGISQVIERGDKRALRTEAGRRNLLAARSDAADMLRQRRIDAANAFYDLLAAQQREAAVGDIARFSRHTAAIAEMRLAHGDISRVDVARVRTDTARAEADADQAHADRKNAQIALAQLLDMSADTERLEADGEWPSPASTDAESAIPVETLLSSRPDVVAARARVEAAQTAVELARAQTHRDVTVGFQVEHNPQNPQYTHSPLYGVSVSFPLLLGNNFHGDIARAEADYTAALQMQRKTEAAADAELRARQAALTAWRQQAQRLTQELLPEAKRAAVAMEFAFERGAVGMLDLLDARRTLKATEQDVINAQSSYAKSLYAWRLEQERRGEDSP